MTHHLALRPGHIPVEPPEGDSVDRTRIPYDPSENRFSEPVDHANQLWIDYPTDYGLVCHEGRLLRTSEVPEADRLLLSAWIGMVYRAASEEAGNSSNMPYLFAYLTDNLLPIGWTKEEAYEELSFETRMDADHLDAGLKRLHDLFHLAFCSQKALEALGWVLEGEHPQGASWLVLCWDAFLSPSRRVIKHSEVQQTGVKQFARNMLESEADYEEVKTAIHEDNEAESAIHEDDTEEWRQILTFLAGQIVDHEDVPADCSSDGPPLRR